MILKQNSSLHKNHPFKNHQFIYHHFATKKYLPHSPKDATRIRPFVETYMSHWSHASGAFRGHRCTFQPGKLGRVGSNGINGISPKNMGIFVVYCNMWQKAMRWIKNKTDIKVVYVCIYIYTLYMYLLLLLYQPKLFILFVCFSLSTFCTLSSMIQVLHKWRIAWYTVYHYCSDFVSVPLWGVCFGVLSICPPGVYVPLAEWRHA